MTEMLIEIPQSTSTKSGEFDLKFNGDNHIVEYLNSKNSTPINYYEVAEALDRIKNSNYYQFDSDTNSTQKICNDRVHDNSSLAAKLYTIFNTKLVAIASSITYSIDLIEKKPEKQRLKQLEKDFANELVSYAHYITSSKTTAQAIFLSIAENAAKINFRDSLVEIAPSNTFYIKLLLPNDELLVITRQFEYTDGLGEDEVVFSLFKDDECLLSEAIDIVSLVKAINEYLDIK